MTKKILTSLEIVGLVTLLTIVYFVFIKAQRNTAPPSAVLAPNREVLLQQRLSEAMAIKEELARPTTADLSYIKDPEQRKKVEDFIKWYNSPKISITTTKK